MSRQYRKKNRNDFLLEGLQPRRAPEIIFQFTEAPTLNILNGNRFMVSSRKGDILEEAHGVFANDTRFLSLFRARVNGEEPTVLTSSNTTHYSAGFYLTNPDLKSQHGSQKIPKESLAIHRMRFIEDDVREEYYVTNVSEDTINVSLSFEVDADFADIFDVKNRVFANRPDMPHRERSDSRRTTNAQNVSKSFLEPDNAFDFRCSDASTNFSARSLVWFSRKGKILSNQNRNEIVFDFSLDRRESYHLTIVIVILAQGEKKKEKYTNQYFERQERKISKVIREWDLSIPKLESNWDELKHAYYQSLIDLASLTMRDPTAKHRWNLPAAGCPWFMTLFGRDTLITSYQSIILGPSLAQGAITALAKYQSTILDPERDAEPGKIIHELRFGKYGIESGRFPYYGSVDSTPLFLILISEIYRWTGDKRFVSKFKGNILRAFSWINDYGDSDGDGFVEYEKKSKGGLDNQCWKDSWNSIQFSSGKIALAPIATCEVQGYVYDAKKRISEIAKEVWKDGSLSKKLEDEANELKKLFNERYWIEEKGYYAIALDKDKRRVDSLTSNNGQLLWTGIVDQDKARSVSEKLVDSALFSGYGVRTMSANDKGYSPLGYHNGCVWAHDNSLIIEGLSRYGKKKEANILADALLTAQLHFGYTMPETFSGFPKLQTGFPVRYPTSSSPQAWAAGASLLILKTLIGITTSPARGTIAMNPIFNEANTALELSGIAAFGKKFAIRLCDGSKPEIKMLRGKKTANTVTPS